MKKNLLAIMLLFFCYALMHAQEIEWRYLNEKFQKKSDLELLQSSEKEIIVQFKLNGYGLEKVETPRGTAYVLLQEKGSPIQKKGAPDLWKLSKSVIIPDFADTEIEIIESDYTEIKNIEIAPSKGVITRNVDPKDVPYEYGIEYKTNAFFPSVVSQIAEPYIIRDFRGQTIHFQPYQYNPVSKTLRVHNSITIRVKSLSTKGVNTLTRTKSTIVRDNVFESIYQNHFLNYADKVDLKAVLPENGGKMLIVTYDNFASQMQPFVDWKNSIGIQTEMVNYSTIGSSAALKTYVQNYYNTNGLTYLLLVGDNAQVPTSGTTAGDSDNNYGYIVGSDHYLDIFVGRFSAENATQVTTQVNRTLHYERDMLSTEPLITKGVGIASNEGTGGSGDMGESDEQHMNNIQTDLAGYGYSITRCYQNGGTTAQLSSLINNGTGIINYVGHGSNYSWAAPSFSTTNVNALTNTNKFPFIISVACVVGNFKNITCFAESWLRATSGGTPTGGLVFCGSTINQSWKSPMRAQDQMNDLLVANTYKSYGGIFVNGMFAMIDAYGTDGQNMADTWTCFGDPSVQTRTPGRKDGPQSGTTCNAPANLTVSNLTETSASISWGAVSSAQSYTFAYKASTSPSWIESVEYSTGKNLTGLAAGTAYEVRVRTNCASGTSSYSPTISFTTTNSTTQYTLSTNTVGQGSVTLNPAGGTYNEGTVVTVSASAALGWEFSSWSGNLSGSTNPATVIMNANKSVTATFVESSGTVEEFGILDAKTSVSTSGNLRAMPLVVPKSGTITHLSMRHRAGSGNMILAVYDGTSTRPNNRIAVTSATVVSNVDGWQQIALETPVHVTANQNIYLAWLYETNPGIYYGTGTPGRVDGATTWTSGMPATWGATASQTNYLYNIKAIYTVDPIGNVAPVAVANGPYNGTVNTAVSFSSNGSYDPDGSIASYAWTFGDGGTSTLANPSHTYTTAGTYNVSLTVTDNEGETGTSSTTATITTVQVPVLTSIVVSPANSTIAVGESQQFIAQGYDQNNNPMSATFTWSATGGTIDATGLFTSDAAGNYTVSAVSGSIAGSASIDVVGVCCGCTSPQYTENGGYSAGSKVQNNGTEFECKPYPYSGWCNGAAWAYEPGTGAYWTDAWTEIGPCIAARGTSAIAELTLENNQVKVYPNPFNAKTMVNLVLADEANAEIKVYNASGQQVIELTHKSLPKGEHNIEIDGSELPSGLYLYKVQINNKVYSGNLLKK